MTAITVEPGDFCVVPVEPPAGLVIEGAQWLQWLIDEHKLHLPQKYEHAEVYVGQPDKAGPYGYTCSAYPNRQGRLPLPCPPAALPGSLWSSGLISLTPEQRAGIVAWCMARQHIPYSSLDYFALIGHTFGLETKWLQDYIQNQGHQICSQYVDSAYAANGVHLFADLRWPGFVTPLDLALLLESKTLLPPSPPSGDVGYF